MSCSGSHLGITINIKNTKFVKDLPMIDAQFRFNQCNKKMFSPVESQVIFLSKETPIVSVGLRTAEVLYTNQKKKA
jgi:hypothetical protein